MILINTAKNLFLFVFIILINQTYSQEYVKNIRINQTGDSLQILYDLKVEDKKNYIDPKHRVKSRKFHVNLFYSSDDGRTYRQINNASGDIEKSVFQGKDKRIVFEPENSKYGMIGKYTFKIDANPKIPKISFGLTYCHNLFTLGGHSDSARVNEFRLNVYKPLGHSISLLLSLGLISANSTYNRIWGDNVLSGVTLDKEHYEVKGTAVTLGVGIQLFNRWISFFGGGGLMFRNKSSSSYTVYDDGNVVYDHGMNNSVKVILQVGIQVKIIDTRLCTILLPITLFLEPSDGDFLTLNSGLSLQF